ncbi:minor tail protein [Mycobacterium phage Ebony]|nr:minor tail protein [Mycobacterium phage Ebony]QHJ86540.1 minor tail protein [Mycobacterium phage Mabel]
MSYPSNKFGAVDAGGAFVIGGGDFNFGQEYTEQIIRGMFKVPAPSLANGLSLLREYLLKMPLEVLETFKPLLPDVAEGAFDTVAGAVDAIMDGLTDVVQFLRLDEWQEFLDKITDGVESTVEDAVEAILSAGEWFRHMIDQLLTALGITPTGSLQDRLFDLSDELEAIQSAAAQAWDDVTDLAQDLLTNPAAVLGTIPKSVVSGLSQMETVLNQITEILAGNVVTPVNSLVQAVKDWWNSLTNKTQNLTNNGKLDAGALVGQVASGAVEGLDDLTSSVVGGFKGIFDSWFGGNSGTGTPTEVAQVIEAIRVAVYGGYIVETIVSDQTWTRPFDPAECLEFWAVPVGGGGRGQTGDTARPGTDEVRTVDGGLGGIDGGYNAVQLDPASIPDTVACTIGPAASTPGATGGVTSFGSLAQSVPGIGAISNGVGFLASASKPGRGGDGGSAFMSRANSTTYTSSPGKAGEGSALAAGGAAGAANGGTGGAGAAAPMDGERKAGGGGGGGGGGRAGNALGTITGGTGGNGGFPGGASGGGGAAININTTGFNVAPGQPGTPANGCLFLIYKLVSGDEE